MNIEYEFFYCSIYLLVTALCLLYKAQIYINKYILENEYMQAEIYLVYQEFYYWYVCLVFLVASYLCFIKKF